MQDRRLFDSQLLGINFGQFFAVIDQQIVVVFLSPYRFGWLCDFVFLFKSAAAVAGNQCNTAITGSVGYQIHVAAAEQSFVADLKITAAAQI